MDLDVHLAAGLMMGTPATSIRLTSCKMTELEGCTEECLSQGY